MRIPRFICRWLKHSKTEIRERSETEAAIHCARCGELLGMYLLGGVGVESGEKWGIVPRGTGFPGNGILRPGGIWKDAVRVNVSEEDSAESVRAKVSAALSAEPGASETGERFVYLPQPDAVKFYAAEWTQDEIGAWQEAKFGAAECSTASILNHLRREVVELEDALNERDGIEEELGDCLLLLNHIAHRSGVDLILAGLEKFERNKLRTWGPPDAEGVREHVEKTITAAEAEAKQASEMAEISRRIERSSNNFIQKTK